MPYRNASPFIMFFRGIVSLVKGLLITFSYMFRRPITIQYPEQRAVLPVRYRGRLVMPVDPEKGTHRCTACMRCIEACPNHSIEVDKVIEDGKPRPRAAAYRYNVGTCMFCNLCVEACAFAAIVMSDEHELATTDRSTLMRELVAEKYVIGGEKGAWWQRKFKPAGTGEKAEE
jgi:NADH-quinone oxidoreductase chain I